MFFPNFDSRGKACVELFNAMGARYRGSLWQVLFIEDFEVFFFSYYFLLLCLYCFGPRMKFEAFIFYFFSTYCI